MEKNKTISGTCIVIANEPVRTYIIVFDNAYPKDVVLAIIVPTSYVYIGSYRVWKLARL